MASNPADIDRFGSHTGNSLDIIRNHCNIELRLDDSVTRADLESINPDVDKLTMVKQTKVRGIIVTIKSCDGAYHFLSRYFAPWVGIKEDPVTGSAHTVLAPYWAQKLNRYNPSRIVFFYEGFRKVYNYFGGGYHHPHKRNCP